MNPPKDSSTPAVLAATMGDEARAAELARDLDLPLLPAAMNPRDCAQVRVALVVEAGTLRLQQTGPRAPGPVRVDFGSAAMRHRRRGGHNELLGRAVGVGKVSPLVVLDATAGLGRDSFVLADLGCRVTLCEREALVQAMLRSALDGAVAEGDSWLTQVVSRMTLSAGDARELAPGRLAGHEVIYLDPMFPERDKSAAVKKEMALFQALFHDSYPAEDAENLLGWALAQDVARVVVKRPPRAPLLGASHPSHQLSSKAVRYDVYTLRAWRSVDGASNH